MTNLKEAEISVIMPFYKGDQAEHLAQALSSLATQTLLAKEIVLIQDGPVSNSLNEVVKKWEQKLPSIKRLVLPKNMGLSAALNAGIDAASYEWLARMDADDICKPDRFEKQWQLITENSHLSILGSWIEEFDEEMQSSIATRRLPEKHDQILHYSRWRCPFNHMTVMYRKSALLELGKYKDFGAVGDDYELWARFLMAGYQSYNLQEVLVQARTGNAMYNKRRRGLKYLRYEINEINALYRMGLLKPWHYLFHVGIKTIVRLAPGFLVKIIYKGIRKTS